MGANMVRRLMNGGHDCVVFDRALAAVEVRVGKGAVGVGSYVEQIARLARPRAL